MQDATNPQSAPAKPNRIGQLDVARGIAMIAMTLFHFSWDLEFFGYAPTGMTSQLAFKLFARAIASSFLIIAGASLMLAHHNGVRWQSFWRRFAMVAGASAIISIATYITTPERFVFFGILHQIAAASLIALLFVRLPAFAIFAVGVAVLALPFYFRSEIFLAPYFWWSGLAPFDPPSNDYVPVFPWTGFVLIGMALAKFALQLGWVAKLSDTNTPRNHVPRFLIVLGNNSLVYYLLHQPIMMAALFGLTLLIPPTPIDKAALFVPQCVVSCESERDKAFCEKFCVCVRSNLEKQSIFQDVLDGKRDVTNDALVLETAAQCTNAAEE
jgi:uncharacterized membrane protein